MSQPPTGPVSPRAPPEASRSLEALRSLVEATTGTGQGFLEALVVNLTRSLGVKHALVGELSDEDPTRSRVLAVAWDGALGAPFTYLLDGTPCERALSAGELAYYPSGVADLFPRDEALARKGIQAYMGCPLLGPGGKRLGILVVLHDRPLEEATEPRTILTIFANRAAAELAALRSEDRLRDREATLRYALAAARMATFDWEPEAGRSAWSDGAAGLLGLPPGGFDGSLEALAAALVPEDRPALAECAMAAAEGLKDTLELEYRVRTPDGRERWLQHRGRVALGPDGRAARISGVLADVTERRQLEASLQHAQKLDAVGRLAGGIAHDFNNLLTVIRSYAELAEEELRDLPQALELVTPIREAAERASGLTRQLLSFARRQVLSPRVIEPAALVRELGKLLRRLLGEQVQLELDLPEGAWPVRIDPGQLEQVLVNLAVNARDAMPGGGTLRVGLAAQALGQAEAAPRLVPPGDYLAFRVHDTGAGMDEATVAQAFEPFFTTKGPDRGTGLGLATCHGIVTQAGGAIWLDSRIGRGTTVTFL
ncbi:MAG: PAS domain-containing protein, partial [Anaeromyxobacter sp.]|nr:PAS domain-containing protein [Anaeromyxobacter sp.]